MIGGFRFALARARAAAAPLVTLTAVAALAALLVVSVAGVIAIVETRDARAALEDAGGERAQIVLTAPGTASPESVAEVALEVLEAGGVGGALVIAEDAGAVALVPDLDRITGAQAVALVDALEGLRDGIEERTGAAVQVAGGLPDTLAGIREGIEARRGPTAVALGLLGLLTAVTVGVVALEAVRARATENALLRARGARRRDLAGLGGLEAFVLAGTGAALGAGAGGALWALVGGAAVGPVLFGATVAAVALVAAAVVMVVTVRTVDRGSSRARAAADVAAVILLAVATALAVWRFAQSGTPVAPRGDGSVILDPLVAVAPALALALAALVAVALATPLARAAAAASTPTRGVAPVTPLRLASRRPGRHAVSITVVAFAVGTVTVAGAYHGSILALGGAPEALRVGADVRVTTIPDDVEAADVAAAASGEASMLARSLTARGGDQRIPILAVEAAALGDVMLDAGGALEPSAMGELLALPSAGPRLSGDTVSLTLTAPAPLPVEIGGESFEPGPAALQVRVTAVAASGAVSRHWFANADVTTFQQGVHTLTEADVRPTVEETLELPPGEEWHLAAVDVAYHATAGWEGTGEITAVSSGGAPVDVSGFRAGAGTAGAVEAIPGGLRFTPEASAARPYTRAVAPGVPAAAPVVVTEALAASLSLEVGDAISLDVASPDFDADFAVAGLVPVLPGTTSGQGILVDLATLSMISPFDLAPNQAWLAAADPVAAAAAVEEAFPSTVAAVADPRSADTAAGTAAAFFVAAAGAVVLAVAVLILRRTRSRADSRELALLAVIGLGRRRAARVRAQEDLFAVAVGVAGGVVAGIATTWLVVPPLVRAAYVTVPDAYPVPLQAEPLVIGGALLVVVAIFVVIALTVRAPARLSGLLREDE